MAVELVNMHEMKTIRVKRFGGPEVLEMEAVSDLIPGPQEILIEVRAIGVNPVDTYVRSGNYPNSTVPYTPGSDAAGIVIALGKEVSRFKVNDRVFTAKTLTGAYAETTLCHETQAHPLPPLISFEQGAGLYVPYATAYRALFQKAKARQGETVFIHGASGGVGIAAIQWGKVAGLRLIGTAGSEEGKFLVLEQGAHSVLNHQDPHYFDQLQELTLGKGPDVILEMLSNVNLEKDLNVISKNGRIVIIGSRGKIEINPRLIMAKDVHVTGMILNNASPEEFNEIFENIDRGLKNGTLCPVVGKTFSLTQAAAAHEAILKPGAYGKIILIP